MRQRQLARLAALAVAPLVLTACGSSASAEGTALGYFKAVYVQRSLAASKPYLAPGTGGWLAGYLHDTQGSPGVPNAPVLVIQAPNAPETNSLQTWLIYPPQMPGMADSVTVQLIHGTWKVVADGTDPPNITSDPPLSLWKQVSLP